MKSIFKTLLLALLGLLVACAGQSEFREGQKLINVGRFDSAVPFLEKAVQADAKNAQYRIGLKEAKTKWLASLLQQANTLLSQDQFEQSLSTYQAVLNLEPNNAMAELGIETVKRAQKHQSLIEEARKFVVANKAQDWQLGLEKVKEVLAENPKHKTAQMLQDQFEELGVPRVSEGVAMTALYRQAISLEFKETPLRVVLDAVTKLSGLNFYIDKDVRGDLKVTVNVKNTAIEDLVRILLLTNQLEQKILNDNSVLIYPNTPQKLKDYQTLVVRSFYLNNADVKAVANTIKTLIKTKDLVMDERLGIIIMRDTAEAIRLAERVVALQDQSDPEVMLHVEILEVKRSRLLELGIAWPGQISLSPLVASGSSLTVDALRNLNGASTSANIGAFAINARKEEGNGNILANPRIRVRNKDKAKVLVGDRVPVITTTTTSTGFVAETINYVDVGLKLEVEPQIYLDEEVAIKVNLEVSNLVREVQSKSGSLAYQIGTRGANTVLRLRNGETQILAGLISDEERNTAYKIPGLGDIPILGRLFGSQKDDAQRSEILLSITPHVVRSLKRPPLHMMEFEAGTESAIGSRGLKLSTELKSTPVSLVAPNLPTPGSPGFITPIATSATSGVNLQNPPKRMAGVVWQGSQKLKVGQLSELQLVFNGVKLDGLMNWVASWNAADFEVTEVRLLHEGLTMDLQLDNTIGRAFGTLASKQGVTNLVTGQNNSLVFTINPKRAVGATRLRLNSLVGGDSSTDDPFSRSMSFPLDHAIQIQP